MAEPIRPENLADQLTAFADGELDAEGNLAVLRYVAGNPDALLAVEQEQRLRMAAQEVIRRDTPAPSDALRRRIEALGAPPAAPGPTLKLSDTGTPFPPTRAPDVPSRSGIRDFRWLAAAAGVVLLLGGSWFGWTMAERRLAQVPNGGSTRVEESVIPIALTHAVTAVHVDCSRLPPHLHGADVAEIQPGLVEPLKEALAGDQLVPDLSSIGYDFVGAGPCGRPVEDAVHLLYHSKSAKVNDTLSLFVRPYTAPIGQTDLQPGRVYEVTPAGSPHKALAWRSGALLWLLVGDAAEPVDRAKNALAEAIRLDPPL